MGRGTVAFHDGLVAVDDCLIHAIDTLPDAFVMSFRARSRGDEVQIWSGFGFHGRDDRYALGLRGGNTNDLYLCRYEPGGKDEMLALASLDSGIVNRSQHELTIVCIRGAIRVYLEGETSPRIAVHDPRYRSHGSVVLGGGWIATEFAGLAVRPLRPSEQARYLKDTVRLAVSPTPAQREERRVLDRARYASVRIGRLTTARTEMSLNGRWLFRPGYEVRPGEDPADPRRSDAGWHVMDVPQFWNPVRNWLHLQESGLPHGGSGVSDNYREKEEQRCASYTFDHRRTTEAWYRQWIDLPDEATGKQVMVRFDAVAMVTDVFVNGVHAGSNVGMFGAFTVDLSPFMKQGANLLAVHVRAAVPDARAGAERSVARAVSVDITNAMLHSLPHGMFGGTEGGIWQPVTLLVTNPVHITDVFAQVRTDGGDMHVTCTNPTGGPVQRTIRLTITKEGSPDVLYTSGPGMTIEIPARDSSTFTYRLAGLAPALWTPETPHLYRLDVRLMKDGAAGAEELDDERSVVIGFRTFEVRGSRFTLNGHPYWLRGANHPPCGIAPNDTLLANRFMQLMHDGNQMATRSHGCPFTETWMVAADRQGVAVSYEGTWPWLMITGAPDDRLVSVWRDEFLGLVKRFRNHPSLFLWTVNNEMSFTMFHHEGDRDQRLKNWTVISDVIKEIRRLHPGAPVSGDSGYNRLPGDYDTVLRPHGIDDGDTDDRHVYFNWYNNDFFQIFNGEFGKRIYWSPGANAGRPYFGQEVSTGYPNNDDGHFCRKYLFRHYVPQAFYGDWAWEDHDPRPGLQRHAFMTKELAEVIRRTAPEAAGLLLFANVCWFRDVYRADRITPYPVYDAVKLAYQPVLPSLELFGRHFYAGTTIRPRVAVVNNAVDGEPLGPSVLEWRVVWRDSVLAAGSHALPAVPHDTTRTDSVTILFPDRLPEAKAACVVQIALRTGDRTIATNAYDILLCSRPWVSLPARLHGKRIGLFDITGQTRALFEALGIPYVHLQDLTEIRLTPMDVLVVANLDAGEEVPYNWEDVRNMPAHGIPVLLLHPGKHLQWLFWSEVDETYENKGRIVNMHLPEHSAFDGVEPFDMAWWQQEGRTLPIVCRRSYRFKSTEGITPLCTYLRPHVYISSPEEELKEMNGVPLAEIRRNGSIIASELELNAGVRDPIAGRVFVNLLSYLMTGASR